MLSYRWKGNHGRLLFFFLQCRVIGEIKEGLSVIGGGGSGGGEEIVKEK